MELPSVKKMDASLRAGALDSKVESVQRLAKMAGVSGTTDDVEVAAESFEKLFATLLVREMNKTLENGFFGEGPGTDTFNGWFEEHMGKALSDDGGLGIAEAVRASLIRKQSGLDEAAAEMQDEVKP